MSFRPQLHDMETLSRGYKARLGYGDGLAGLPPFSADRSYIAGYERALADVRSEPGCPVSSSDPSRVHSGSM